MSTLISVTILWFLPILLFCQVCNVCSEKYDLFLKVDDGLNQLHSLFNLSRPHQSLSHNVSPEMKHKVFGQKLKRKYFSEITADEMELLVDKFRSDFLLFNYTFDRYNKALKT